MKITRVCEKLLFTNTKITIQDFKKECDVILPAFIERIVAFLNVLPKNYALFQALESVFEYLLYDYEILSKAEKRNILMVENLLGKPKLEKYELVAGVKIIINYPYMLTHACETMLRTKAKRRKSDLETPIFFLSHWLGDLWFDYHDKKELEYEIIAYDNYFQFEINSRKVYENFEQMARSVILQERKFSDSCLDVDNLQGEILFKFDSDDELTFRFLRN